MIRGFTLIELLVVISIIALLMGILLPVMGRARLQAKVIAVNAELREIGMALEAYSFDNDDTSENVCFRLLRSCKRKNCNSHLQPI